jgi:hypothetical protein
MKWNFIRDHLERSLVIFKAADEQSVSSSGSSGSMRSRLLREELAEMKKNRWKILAKLIASKWKI